MMNVRKGVRRLALFAGALGAVSGIFASYLVCHEVLAERTRYSEFNMLANSESAPSRWLYLLAATLPLLGFFLPWGLVRAVGWVGAGFSATPK